MVLKRLSKALRGKEPPRVPPGRRVYAIGDIHGRSDLLDGLLAQIRLDDAARGPADTTLIILGDMVDRGPNSAGVLERLVDLHEADGDVRFLCGNHDEVFLKALKGDAKSLRFLVRIGGKETILSYGISPADYDGADFEALAKMVAAAVPQRHIAFLDRLDDMVEVGDYLFVHAGIRPDLPLAEQKPSDMRWIRDEFLSCRSNHPRFVIHGHSISADADLRSNRIGIDTGAFASGKLTAIGLEGEERWFLTEAGEPDRSWGLLTD